jgi:molybdopterin molybdotransferase
MDEIIEKCCSFSQAQAAILTKIVRQAEEIIGLEAAYQRITSRDVVTMVPQPSYDESTRDGFVLACTAGPEDKSACQFSVAGEIPAGKPYDTPLEAGTACKIMTGGCIPEGGIRVVPYEDCVEQDGRVKVPNHLLQASNTFIRRAGSEIGQGDLLVPAGAMLQAGHLAFLSSCGIPSVAVSTRPSVGWVCTGSELIASAGTLASGRKFSSNAFLIKGLLASVGARPVDMGIVKDTDRELAELFARVGAEPPDVMLTTGGMGPGKYDLVEKAFVEAGGKIVFNALSMRPGKSVLFGILGRTLFFGLPGPPNAVRALLNALVGPALLAMQGATGSWPQKVQAHLLHPIDITRNDLLRVKEGVLAMGRGSLSVRYAERLEIPNCYILLPPGQAQYGAGEVVDVHLALGSGLNS